MPNRSRLALTASAIVTGALLLSACASGGSNETDSEATSDSSASEDTSLVIYSGRDEELIAPLIELFEEESGITTEVRYANTTEMAAQLLEEGEQTPAQVFLSQDAGALGAISEAGMFSELPADLTETVPAEFTSQDGSWVGLTGRARVIAYDSEEYTEADVPADVFELTDPEWKGKVGIAPSNASFQSFVTAMRVAEGAEATQEWLDGLVANEAQIFESNGDILEAVNSGGVDLGLINHYYWARSEQDPNELRAQLKFGDAGSVSALVNVTGAGILTGAADSPAAEEFVSFLVSDTAQQYFLEETFEYPLATGETPANVPALDELGGPDINLSELSSLEDSVAQITEAGLL